MIQQLGYSTSVPPDQCDAIFQELQPDAVIHLAGISFVPACWDDPRQAVEININGTINILEALRKHSPKTKALIVTSAEIYGFKHDEASLDESITPLPDNFYGATKLTADRMALLYAEHYGLHVCTARPQNHIGPKQSNRFVVTAFAKQLAERADQNPVAPMKIGNLASERVFLDVRDVAHAYRLIIEKGHAGEAYNIGSGKRIPISYILDTLCDIANVHPKRIVSEKYFRPTSLAPVLDTKKIREHTGWKTEISLEQSLKDIYQEQANKAQSVQ